MNNKVLKMSLNRENLPPSQLYESRCATVQVRKSNYNQSLENLYQHLKQKEELKKLDDEIRYSRIEIVEGRIIKFFAYIWNHTFAQLGDDWVFLAFLGIIVAMISYSIDKGIMISGQTKMWLYRDLAQHDFAKYIGWISLPIVLILFDVGFTHIVAPQAAGSGLPQIKTSLRGVIIKECLTFRTLIAKWVGLTCTIGSGLPLGKEGPIIHISSITMILLTKLAASFRGIYLHESRTIEMLGAAWACGVACTFNAPIGGVLFSVEITTAYFAVRNYWRGFFAAVWGAVTYRLLSVWIDGLHTITVVFKASYFVDFPYDPQELFAFALTGLICGLGGSFYIWCKQNYDKWLNSNAAISKIRNLNRFIYPTFIILLVSSVTFPPGIGQFIASDITPRDQVINLFSNFTWTSTNHTLTQRSILTHWTTKYSGIYTSLVSYFAFEFIFSIIGSTLPIPNGVFIPSFRAGAAVGRIIGELMHEWFPLGVRYNGKISQIIPGAYAAVGAAAFSGAVTHTMSVCVILFEMTSQITYVVPVLIAVLISNGIASLLTPSIYDLVIRSKKLPYLPDLLPNSSAIYNVCVQNFMVQDVKFIYLDMTYSELKIILQNNRKIKTFPLVDHPNNRILIGSVPTKSLLHLLKNQLGKMQRYEEFSINYEDNFNHRMPMDETVEESKGGEFQKIQPRIHELPHEQQNNWEKNQLEKKVNFTLCKIDPAPFQLVEKTSLLKVHSLFSLLAINLAYVTSIGKLVGVVGLSELRKAIENANSRNTAKKLTSSTSKQLLNRS